MCKYHEFKTQLPCSVCVFHPLDIYCIQFYGFQLRFKQVGGPQSPARLPEDTLQGFVLDMLSGAVSAWTRLSLNLFSDPFASFWLHVLCLCTEFWISSCWIVDWIWLGSLGVVFIWIAQLSTNTTDYSPLVSLIYWTTETVLPLWSPSLCWLSIFHLWVPFNTLVTIWAKNFTYIHCYK